MIRVELVRAWPRRDESHWLELPEDATVADAVAASPWQDIGPLAVFGERVALDHRLEEGDRIEVLRPLVADPKDSRRKRALKGAG